MEIPDFMALVEKLLGAPMDEVRFIYSKKFRLYDIKWRMKIYPAGNHSGLNTHLSAFVELIDLISDKVSVVYQLELAPETEKPFVRAYTSAFELMDSWGWNKLLPLSDVGQYVGEQGAMRLRLGVRPETYGDAVKIARNKQQVLDGRLAKMRREPEARRVSARPHV